MYKLNILMLTLLLFFGGCGGDTPSPGEEQGSARTVRLNKIAELGRKLDETSGMIMVDGKLYTHNDSGNRPYLYEIDPANGKIIRSIHIEGAVNRDWEDLAQDDTYIYIADTGNNLGKRRDLNIYRVSKNDLLNSDDIPSESIKIAYEDQSSFNYSRYTTPFDAEALIAFDGSLYLFSKNWNDYTTSIYKIPTIPGNYKIRPLFKKKLNIMVTAADFDPETHSIALIGYANIYKDLPSASMVFILSDYNENDFFSGISLALKIENSMEVGQIEAVAFGNGGKNDLFISAEGNPAVLYKMSIPK